MKIDLHKVFDSVHCQFLRELMIHMKFPLQFVNRIMGCLTLVTYKIHVNGQIGDAFKGGRGLKQGDPLSCLLLSLQWNILLG